MSKIPGPGSRLPQPGVSRKSKAIPVLPKPGPSWTKEPHQHLPEESLAEHWRQQVGKKVRLPNKEVGILRYFGRTTFANGNWCGIQLMRPEGKNDGSVKGVRYFTCEPNFGLFAPVDIVEVVEDRILYDPSVTSKPYLWPSRDVKDSFVPPQPGETAVIGSTNQEMMLLETLRKQQHHKPDLIKSCEYSNSESWWRIHGRDQPHPEHQQEYSADEDDEMVTPTVETFNPPQFKRIAEEKRIPKASEPKFNNLPKYRNEGDYYEEEEYVEYDYNDDDSQSKQNFRFTLEEDIPEELYQQFDPRNDGEWYQEDEEEYASDTGQVIEDSVAPAASSSENTARLALKINPGTCSWAEGSITTSIISMSSLDGYQGDGEYEPRSEGGSGAANSPIEPEKSFAGASHPVAKHLEGHSDSDFCSDAAACTESEAEVEERLTPMTRSQTFSVANTDSVVAEDQIRDLPKLPMTQSEMESSGIYSDIDLKELETQRRLKSKPTLETVESSTVSPEEAVDIQEQWQAAQNFPLTPDSGPYSIQINQSDPTCDSDNTVQEKCSSSNDLADADRDDDTESQVSRPEEQDDRKSRRKLQRRARVEVSKPQKVVIKNVESKVKAMMKEAPQREDVKKIVRQPKKPGRWDNVMSQIAQNKVDEKKKPRREVRSKVFANIGPPVKLPPRPSSAASSVVSEKIAPCTPRSSASKDSSSSHGVPATPEEGTEVKNTERNKLPTRPKPREPDNKGMMVISGRKGGPIEKLKEQVLKLQRELKTVNEQLERSDRGFIAMSVLLQYMHTDLNAFSTPILQRQLNNLHNTVTNLQQQLDAASKEKSLLQEELALLTKQRQNDIESMDRKYEETVEAHSSRVKQMNEQHEEELNQTQQQTKKEVERVRADKEEEARRCQRHTESLISDLKLEHGDQLREVNSKLAAIQEESAGHKQRADNLQEECTRYQQEFRKMEETMLKDANVKIQVLAERCRGLQKDAESHKAVLDIKTQELQDSRQHILELEKQVDELKSYREQALYLHQKCEDLEAQIGQKQDQERALIQEQEQLHDVLRKENKENKRLCMEVEGLQWKIRHNAKLSENCGEVNNKIASGKLSDRRRGTTPSPVPSPCLARKVDDDSVKKRQLPVIGALPSTPEAASESQSLVRLTGDPGCFSSSEDLSLPPTSPLVKNVYVGRDKALSYTLDLESDREDSLSYQSDAQS